MKTLGLIGGLSWHSTIDYYRMINQQVNGRLGGVHSAPLYLYSVNFDIIKRLTLADDWKSLSTFIRDVAVRLEHAGANGLVICANTMHHIADDIQAAINIPLINIADATATAIRQKGLSKIALLGTRFTMQLPFYHQKLRQQNIETLIPGDADISFLNEAIYEEMGKGVFSAATRDRVLHIISDLQTKGAEGAILGCTELPILLKDQTQSIPFFDTAEIHANAAVDFMLAG